MSSVFAESSKKCVAVVDPDQRSGRRIFRMVSRLGHLPVAIQDAEALRARGVRPRAFDLLLVTPASNDLVLAMEAVEEVHSIVGVHVPIGLIATRCDLRRAFMVVRAGPGDDAIAASADTEEILRFIERLLQPRGPSVLAACWE